MKNNTQLSNLIKALNTDTPFSHVKSVIKNKNTIAFASGLYNHHTNNNSTVNKKTLNLTPKK